MGRRSSGRLLYMDPLLLLSKTQDPRRFWYPPDPPMSDMPEPPLALTFDDVSIVPGLSETHPNDVDLRTRVCRGITMNIPILSAAMDTVTESRLAIALAQEGGIGIVHKNLPVEVQADEVDKVKRSEAGMIVRP